MGFGRVVSQRPLGSPGGDVVFVVGWMALELVGEPGLETHIWEPPMVLKP